jgi:hypothetical protein
MRLHPNRGFPGFPPIVLVFVFLLLFRLPPSKIEDENEHEDEHD